MIFQQLSLSYIPRESGDTNVTNLSRSENTSHIVESFIFNVIFFYYLADSKLLQFFSFSFHPSHLFSTFSHFSNFFFSYLLPSLVMEEAAQILEIETLIPMLLQNAEVVHSSAGEESTTGCRLKRIILIGDHYQLPPVVKHMAFQKHAHLDQSLFTRFIRLGVPAVLLNRQGRARPEIAALYSWRYAALGGRGNAEGSGGVGGKEGLGDLPIVTQAPAYRVGNAGFVNTFQLIDVPEFQGKGEFCPTPHFYQNLGEAEYVVAVFQYMRLLGYPAEKISIITTYNGQKHLIRDVIAQRCKGPMFGRPADVTTGKS